MASPSISTTLLDHGRLGEATYSSLFRCWSRPRPLGVTGRPRAGPGAGAVVSGGARWWPKRRRGLRATRRAGVLVDSVDPATRADATHICTRAQSVRDASRLRAGRRRASARLRSNFDIGEYRQVGARAWRRRPRSTREGRTRVRLEVHLHATFDYAIRPAARCGCWQRTRGSTPTVRHAYATWAIVRTTPLVSPPSRQHWGGKPERPATLRPRYVTSLRMGDGVAEAAGVIRAFAASCDKEPRRKCLKLTS